MSLFEPAPEPPTSLGRYRVLSKTAGIRVSPLQLGAMSLGKAWEGFLGSMDKKGAFELLDAFVAAGGNFIDTYALHAGIHATTIKIEILPADTQQRQ